MIPAVSVSLIAFITWLAASSSPRCSSCSRRKAPKAEILTETETTTVDQAKKAAKEAFDKAKDAAKSAYEKAKEAAKEAYEKVKEAVGSTETKK